MKTQYIQKASDLVTTLEQTRAGFISFALEKNRRSTPIIENAKSLKVLASKAATPLELLKIRDIYPSLLASAGISDKALVYFSENDKEDAIKALIKNFLEPAGDYFIDELVYRYLLIKGDSLGGQMRNLVGAIAQQRLIRNLLSNLDIMDLDYKWLGSDSKLWKNKQNRAGNIEEVLKAITWDYEGKKRLLAFNLTLPIIKKNVDICLFDANEKNFNGGQIVQHAEKVIMLGELKGGIDPAGADEHWKTANSALERIRKGFSSNDLDINTSFVGAAIANNMAEEILNQLENETLNYAANLTVDEQLVDYCNWIITQ